MAIVQAVTDHLKKDPTNSTLLTTLAELWALDILTFALARHLNNKHSIQAQDEHVMLASPSSWHFTHLHNISHLFKTLFCCRYTYDQRYDRALEIYLKLRHKDVYQLIHKHNLFSSIEDKIVLLMDFDKEVIFTCLFLTPLSFFQLTNWLV